MDEIDLFNQLLMAFDAMDHVALLNVYVSSTALHPNLSPKLKIMSNYATFSHYFAFTLPQLDRKYCSFSEVLISAWTQS